MLIPNGIIRGRGGECSLGNRLYLAITVCLNLDSVFLYSDAASDATSGDVMNYFIMTHFYRSPLSLLKICLWLWEIKVQS